MSEEKLMDEKEIAVIGRSAELVTPFLALGIRHHETHDADTARTLLAELAADSNVGLILISETIASMILGEIDALKRKTSPAVLILPKYNSTTQLGLKRLEQMMSKATGKVST